MNQPKCISQTKASWWQEWYDGTGRDASIRARILRKAGYQVSLSQKQEQITPLGRLKMQMLTIYNPDDNVPLVDVVGWR